MPNSTPAFVHPVVSILTAGVVAAGVAFALRPAEAAPDQGGVLELQRTVGELQQAQQQLTARLDALAAAPAAARSEPERTGPVAPSDQQVAAAVEAYLRQRGNGAAAEAAAGGAAAAFDVDAEFAALKGTDFFGNPAAWKRAHAAGKLDEIVARFEAQAKANPGSPDAQMQLAKAYLAYTNIDPSKYEFSLKADGAFDKVLELDDHHWEARFTKALSATFWPEFLGKRKPAIAHFETLVAQQEAMPASPEQAQTYLYLGNLLERTDPAKAREMWAKGARRHPDSQELAKKLAGK
ncbi:MAG: tetratricopeptide repeat protein [Planctomycetota bacterium]